MQGVRFGQNEESFEQVSQWIWKPLVVEEVWDNLGKNLSS